MEINSVTISFAPFSRPHDARGVESPECGNGEQRARCHTRSGRGVDTVQISEEALTRLWNEIKTQQQGESAESTPQDPNVEAGAERTAPDLERLINRIGRLFRRFLHQLREAGFGARGHHGRNGVERHGHRHDPITVTVQFSTPPVAQAGETETQQPVEQKAGETSGVRIEFSIRHATANLERLINRIGRLVQRLLHRLSVAGVDTPEPDVADVREQQERAGPPSDTVASPDSPLARFAAMLDRLSSWIDRLIEREPVAAPDGGQQAAPAADDAEVVG